MTTKWWDDPRYAGWRISVDFVIFKTQRYYFILDRDEEEEPQRCAFVANDEVIHELVLICQDTVEEFLNGGITYLEGIDLDNSRIAISEDDERYAYVFYENQEPRLCIDGNAYRLSAKLGDQEVCVDPGKIWFSNSGDKCAISGYWWITSSNIDSLEAELEGMLEEIFEDDEDRYIFPKMISSDQYWEMNGSGKKPIPRSGSLKWYESPKGSRNIAVTYTEDGQLQVKIGTSILISTVSLYCFHFIICHPDFKEELCVENPYFAHDPSKRYYCFSMDNGENNFDVHIIDIDRVFDSSEQGASPKHWICATEKNFLPSKVLWQNNGFTLFGIRNNRQAHCRIELS